MTTQESKQDPEIRLIGQREATAGGWGKENYPYPAGPALLRYAGEGIRNNHLGYHPIVEKSNHLEHYLKYHAWTDGCPGCANPCFTPFFRNDGPRAFGGEMRHDDLGGFNANIMCGYEDMKEDRVPAVLAEGFRRAYPVFGESSRWYAYEIHGVACPTYDVRNKDMPWPVLCHKSYRGALRIRHSCPAARIRHRVQLCHARGLPGFGL